MSFCDVQGTVAGKGKECLEDLKKCVRLFLQRNECNNPVNILINSFAVNITAWTVEKRFMELFCSILARIPFSFQM